MLNKMIPETILPGIVCVCVCVGENLTQYYLK